RKTRAAKKRFPPLYRGSRRETWSGLGEVPGWVVDQIFQGRLIDDFLVRTDDGPELHRLIEKAGESIDAGVARFEEESRHSRRPTPAPQKRREWRVVAAYSPKSAPSSRPVFHGPDGQKWDGEDPKPQWVEECLACGMPLEALKNPEAVRKKFPTRFMSRIGERWSGVGEVPEWLVQEVENGEVPDAFAVWPPEENCPELRELIEKVWKGAAAAKPKAAPQPDAGRRPLKLEPGHLLDADLMAGGPFARLFSPEPQRLPPKYFGPQGEEWSGRGRRPGWVAASLADGATVKDLTEPGAARDILLAHRPRTGSHWERIAPDSDWKMVGPKGQIWKGWGPEPEWVEYALEQGWTREELTNPDWVDPDPVRPKDIVWDRYLGPNGEEWSGRGRQPRWLVEQIIQGRTQEEFLNPKYLGEQESVERNAAPSELMAEPVEPPPRFVGPMGEEWSGCGLRPRWLEEKLEEGWSLDDFRNPEYEDDAAEAPEENDRDVAEDIEDVNAVEDIEPAEAAEEAAEDEPGSSDPGETPVVPSSTARFLGPDGQEWSGRGRRPRWIMEALEAGRSMDDFRNPAYREEAGEDAEAPEDIDVAQKEAPEAELAEETGTPGDLPPPKYLGPNGERWEGRGPQPRWLVDLLFKGRHMKDFLNPAWREPGKPVYVGPGWAKYAGPHGEAWSGFGRCPRWLKELTASGGSREDFRNPQYGKEDLSPAKYLGPNGERWDGRGKYPKWALEARKQGHWLREFRNPAFDEANGITQQDPVRAAERGVKYLGPDGQEWNGRGRVPQWFMQLLRDGWAEGDLLVR
ncbi:H-NS family nucleoid-associated regulatory protein, partial [Sutterella sp.]|uniref:H-NS family nucleoid-associated regulatory protein n=1 Tax=Sutterella sp. TaxID=1981025 RepID=UPI0026E0A22D